MESKTVETRHANVRYLEGGKGEPLLFLHGAGGMTAEDPFLAALAERHHVFAPFLPGYGETLECGEIRDKIRRASRCGRAPSSARANVRHGSPTKRCPGR